MNINDSHIKLIKWLDYQSLDLSNNKISYKGFKELMDSLRENFWNISIYNNPIGDKGIEFICKYIRKFDYGYTYNLSSIL